MTCRKKPAYRSPDLLAEDIFNSVEHLNAPVMIIGDIFQAGKDYGFRLLSALKRDFFKFNRYSLRKSSANSSNRTRSK